MWLQSQLGILLFGLLIAVLIVPVNNLIAQGEQISISQIKNLSNDNAQSTNPRITASDTNVYITWQGEIFRDENDGIFIRKNVLFRKGVDYGERFADITKLVEVDSARGPHWVNLAASSSNVYVTWVNGSNHMEPKDMENGRENTDLFIRFNNACAETEFSEEVNISNSASTSVLPLPQLQAQGGIVYLVWSESHEDGTDLFLKRSKDNGQTFEDKINLTKETGSKEIQGTLSDTVAYLSDFYVVWTDHDEDGMKRLYWKRSINYGETFEDPVVISTYPKDSVGAIDDPRVAASLDKSYVVWRDNNTPTHKFAINFRAITDYGRNIAETVTLSDISGEADQPEIAVYESNVFVVWQDYTDSENPEVMFRASTDGGRTFGKIINLSNSKGASQQVRIVALQDSVYVVWREESNSNADIILASSNDKGSTFKTFNLSNNSGYSSSPQITAENNHGRVYVVWEDATPGNFDIFLRVITDNNHPLQRAPALGKGIIITEVELSPPESESMGQWIEVHNPTNNTISAGGLGVRQPECQYPSFFLTSVELQPNEYRVIEIWEKEHLDLGFPRENTAISLWVNMELFRTAELTDIFSDSRTWQLDGKEWVFVEGTPSKAIPEFPISVLIASVAIGVMIALMRFRKFIAN